MKRFHVYSFIFVLLYLTSLPTLAAPKFELKQLQGAWWSDSSAPTAEFGIHGEQVWVDSDSEYHPCKIDGDILIFQFDADRVVKNRIVSLKGDRMVLQDMTTKKKSVLTRVRQ